MYAIAWGETLDAAVFENDTMVAARVRKGQIYLDGWHYVIEEGRVEVLDVQSGRFIAAEAARGEPARDVIDLLQ